MANRHVEKNSAAVRKQLEAHKFVGIDGEEYGASRFGELGDYLRRKKIKLQNEDMVMRQTVRRSQIFKDVIAHVASYTQPAPEELHRMLVMHGASFIKYLDYKTMVTHIIASTLPPKKADEWRRLRVVKPAWVVDSVAAGKLLPWSDYRLISEGPGQKRLQFADGGKLTVKEGQPDQMDDYREQSKHGHYNAVMEQVAAVYDQTGATSSSKDSSLLSPPELQTMTPEEHNRLLLADPKLRQSSTANPDFLKQFYSESRLHHLSTWKAELKAKMQRLAMARAGARAAAAAAAGAADTAQQKATKKDPSRRRFIMHVDFDSFFCAVSLKRAPPEYADSPAAVAHSSGSASEIASCNYPARAFGVKNGMWMRRALELCPDLKVLPYDFPAYEEASQLFYEAILDVGGVVQSVSVDEALVDVTSIVGDDVDADADAAARADQIATGLRQRIKDKTGCNVSVGIGGNILLAKLALRRAKPAGQHQILPDDMYKVLDDLQVEQLPGVAHSIGGKLDEKLGVKLVSELRRVSRDRLMTVLGPKTGTRLYEYARGIDRVEVGADVDGEQQTARKSVSAEVNWGIRFVSQDEAEEFVLNLCRELERRLLNEHVKGRSLTMKILRRAAGAPLDPEKHLGHGKCDVFNKTVLFGIATHDAALIGKEAVSILRSFHFSPGDLRGLGVQLQKLEPIRAYTGNAGPLDSSQKTLSFSFAKPAPMLPPPRPEARSSPQSDIAPRQSIEPIDRERRDSRQTEAEKWEAPPAAAFPSTQFVMPSNPDPSVLAELPPDIIRRLVGVRTRGGDDVSPDTGSESAKDSDASSRNASPAKRGRASTTTAPPDLPPDIDPQVFAALPADVRADVLAEYRRQSNASPATSPKRAQKTKAKGGSPVKKGIWGTRGLAAQAAARERRHDAQNNRVQTSIARAILSQCGSGNGSGSGTGHSNGHHDSLGDLDPEVLAALPDDVRREVLEDYDRRQAEAQDQDQDQLQVQVQPVMQHLRLQLPPKKPAATPATLPALPQMCSDPMLHFPPLPPKMGFRTAEADGSGSGSGSARVLSLADIKAMLRTWHAATREEGPHETDVTVLERYLAGVITQERDMAKARKVVVWLEWLVGQGHGGVDSIADALDDTDSWQYALARVKAAVQAAMEERGLDDMVF